MKQFCSFVWLSIVLSTSLFINGIGAAFNAVGKMAHIYFVTLGAHHDEKYALKQATPKEEPVTVDDLVGDKDFN